MLLTSLTIAQATRPEYTKKPSCQDISILPNAVKMVPKIIVCRFIGY
jgi:hypothetical protein